ncbi:MAG: hypothetical protein U0Z26_16855 [Anaerolineales bacterium]
MKSRWIEYNDKKIFYQDFSNLFYNVQAVKNELAAVEEIVLNEPENSVLVISDFTNTEVSGEILPIMNQSSRNTKSHVRKVAVLGITGIRRTFGDLLSRLTGQSLMYFSNENEAKHWLVQD